MQKFLAPILSFLAILGVVGSYYLFYSLNKKVDAIKVPDAKIEEVENPVNDSVVGCGEECRQEIDRKVAEAIATISAVPKPASQVTSPSTKNQTVYIPLDGPVSTTSTSWIDIPGVEVSIDLANDYSTNAKVSWEAALKVAYGNGQAFARLFDVTLGNAVDGSEISTTGNITSTNVSSGYMSLWSGRNLYRLQLKSLTSYDVTFSSGRIKVTY